MKRNDIRLGLPSKGRLESGALDFLASCGLQVRKPNPRQYQAIIPVLPGVKVIFQRPGDIVVGVRSGSIDFGITGLDIVEEQRATRGDVVVLHDELGFGRCTLELAVPEGWADVRSLQALAARLEELPGPLRVATKFPELTGDYLAANGLPGCELISAEGTLEVAPAVGYADIIADLVSSGQTLRDNRLHTLSDGCILQSQAVLIGNRASLRERPEALTVARELLEFAEAHLRAQRYYIVVANMREPSAQAVAERMFAETELGGLQGPTVSRVVTREGQTDLCAVEVVVPKERLGQAVNELRAIGGSGVVVSPVSYIFEEEPERYAALLVALDIREK